MILQVAPPVVVKAPLSASGAWIRETSFITVNFDEPGYSFATTETFTGTYFESLKRCSSSIPQSLSRIHAGTPRSPTAWTLSPAVG